MWCKRKCDKKRKMGWIKKHEIPEEHWYVEIFQKIMYRQYKEYIIDSVWFYRILDLHSQNYNLLKTGKITVKKYLDICWIITDKFLKMAKQKEKKGLPEMIEAVKGMYGFVQNRKKEET